ncbi:class I SAM-dependent methyltransferase [Nonomuraea sp. NPDC003804]|uniref:class I SAM-dependent methyltransferase n=1 Tax=Nonomuraea sp. NPDC003804 TaxID=3154547 RepID=UPI0033B315DA
MDHDAFLALLTPRGQKALAEAVELASGDPVVAATRLRRTYDAALTSAALTQAKLRERGRAKFGDDAALMYFTPHGVEQATRREVAEHRARRIALLAARPPAVPASPHEIPSTPQGAPPRPGSRLRVVDVCSGIGGDLVALARAGCEVDAVDTDPLTVSVALANADALGLSDRVTVRTADAASVDPAAYDVLFADPARRTAKGRTFDPNAYSPTWPVILDLLERAPAACLKVAPGIPYEFVPPGAEAEWVSFKGEVKEAAIWTGALSGMAVDAGQAETDAGGRAVPRARIGEAAAGAAEFDRRATLLPEGGTLTPTGAQAPVGPVGRYVYEPDGAAIRAHLVAEVAAMVNGRLADPLIAYITGDDLVDTVWASRYEVNEVMPFSVKKLRAALRARNVGNVTIKKRASAVDIERLRSDLRLSGNISAVVILTRISDRPSVLICTPPELGK